VSKWLALLSWLLDRLFIVTNPLMSHDYFDDDLFPVYRTHIHKLHSEDERAWTDMTGKLFLFFG